MDGTAVTLDLLPPLVSLPAGLTVGTALLHVAPSRLVPRPNGTGVVRVTAPHGLAPGDVVAWKAEDLSIQFAGVLEAAGAVLRLQPAPGAKVPPKESTPLVRAAAISRAQFAANNLEWRLPDMTRSGDFRVTFAAGDGALHAGLAESDLGVDEPLTADNKPSGYVRLTAAALSSARQIWFADPGTDKPATIVRAVSFDTTRTLEFDGKPPALAIDDVVILETPEGDVPAHVNRIAAIDRDAGGYRLTMAADLPPQPVAAVHAGFAATLRPRDHDVDLTPLAGDTLDLDLNSDPAGWSLLRHNRRLVLGSASGAFAPFLARIVTADPQAGSIRIDRPLDPAQVTRGDLIIRANVVNAGHGETKPDRVLGSGDASAIHQRFLIDADDVSHVRDVSMPAGVRADIRVEAEREIYSQVATLRDSTPSDPHYVARVTATGALELEFGDGRHGRRLPTGANNVSARIRRGAGLAGNLPAGKLTDIVKKHPAIDAILQPIAASGGDDREAVDQIRQNAPRRLIAMDRAISVADYQHLVERFQGVWHAVALEQAEFSRSRAGLRLVVVPAGGGALGELAGQISDYLAASGLPSVAIAVEPFVALAANIAVDVRVASRRFDPTDVQERVRAALLAAFDLRRRRPGQPLDRSEVIGIVENTVGVSHCDVVKFATAAASPGDRAAGSSDGTIWTLFPLDNEVIYAADPAQVTVTIAEATR
jgi:predicted phage baseplate assembly protein